MYNNNPEAIMHLLKSLQRGYRIRAWLAALTFVAAAGVTHAIPYASGVKLEGGILTFVLNENAQNVKVIAGATTRDLGALNKGIIVTNRYVMHTAALAPNATSDEAFVNFD